MREVHYLREVEGGAQVNVTELGAGHTHYIVYGPRHGAGHKLLLAFSITRGGALVGDSRDIETLRRVKYRVWNPGKYD